MIFRVCAKLSRSLSTGNLNSIEYQWVVNVTQISLVRAAASVCAITRSSTVCDATGKALNLSSASVEISLFLSDTISSAGAPLLFFMGFFHFPNFFSLFPNLSCRCCFSTIDRSASFTLHHRLYTYTLNWTETGTKPTKNWRKRGEKKSSVVCSLTLLLAVACAKLIVEFFFHFFVSKQNSSKHSRLIYR